MRPASLLNVIFGIAGAFRSWDNRLVLRSSVSTLLLLLASAGDLYGAAAGRRLWDLDISKLLHKAANSETGADAVWGIGFSPDETKLAIGFGQRRTADPHSLLGDLVIVSIDHPTMVLQKFEVPAATFPAASVIWSPSGRVLVVVGNSKTVLVSLSGGDSCSPPRG